MLCVCDNKSHWNPRVISSAFCATTRSSAGHIRTSHLFAEWMVFFCLSDWACTAVKCSIMSFQSLRLICSWNGVHTMHRSPWRLDDCCYLRMHVTHSIQTHSIYFTFKRSVQRVIFFALPLLIPWKFSDSIISNTNSPFHSCRMGELWYEYSPTNNNNKKKRQIKNKNMNRGRK